MQQSNDVSIAVDPPIRDAYLFDEWSEASRNVFMIHPAFAIKQGENAQLVRHKDIDWTRLSTLVVVDPKPEHVFIDHVTKGYRRFWRRQQEAVLASGNSIQAIRRRNLFRVALPIFWDGHRGSGHLLHSGVQDQFVYVPRRMAPQPRSGMAAPPLPRAQVVKRRETMYLTCNGIVQRSLVHVFRLLDNNNPESLISKSRGRLETLLRQLRPVFLVILHCFQQGIYLGTIEPNNIVSFFPYRETEGPMPVQMYDPRRIVAAKNVPVNSTARAAGRRDQKVFASYVVTIPLLRTELERYRASNIGKRRNMPDPRNRTPPPPLFNQETFMDGRFVLFDYFTAAAAADDRDKETDPTGQIFFTDMFNKPGRLLQQQYMFHTPFYFATVIDRPTNDIRNFFQDTILQQIDLDTNLGKFTDWYRGLKLSGPPLYRRFYDALTATRAGEEQVDFIEHWTDTCRKSEYYQTFEHKAQRADMYATGVIMLRLVYMHRNALNVELSPTITLLLETIMLVCICPMYNNLMLDQYVLLLNMFFIGARDTGSVAAIREASIPNSSPLSQWNQVDVKQLINTGQLYNNNLFRLWHTCITIAENAYNQQPNNPTN